MRGNAQAIVDPSITDDPNFDPVQEDEIVDQVEIGFDSHVDVCCKVDTCVKKHFEHYRESSKVTQAHYIMVGCGNNGNLVECSICHVRLCLAISPMSSGCLLPHGSGSNPFDPSTFKCPQCHIGSYTFPNYEILKMEYEQYVFGKTLDPAVVLTFTQGIRSSTLHLLAQIALMDGYRYCLPDLYWRDYDLSTGSHASDNGTVEARKFITSRDGDCNFFFLWDSHSETGTGNLVFGGNSQDGFKSDTVNSLLDANLGPILVDKLPDIHGESWNSSIHKHKLPFCQFASHQTMDSKHFDFVVAFCGGSVVPSNIALNFVKVFNMMAVYEHSIFAAVEIAFGSDIITLTHSPVGVVTCIEATAFQDSCVVIQTLVQANLFFCPIGVNPAPCPSPSCQLSILHVR
ncbi:hypothetical protein JAAARDRAFT_201154 [Jaapia argillacea MUCL 33604]|uniref:Uncharacterized protein n=1 Tax=Jaapia argillacea MUCL 33604 TaxID=933084 RepID=A0A067P2D2_9AGAM|nr:hypothetical protein JAAARDRAFT_201154 [Jaapia argillacea MUCL 33604]